jgi:hypothetical protein
VLLNSLRSEQATEVVIISVDRDEIAEIAVEGGAGVNQLNLILGWVVLRIDPDDLHTRLAVCLQKAAAADVEEDVVHLGKGDGVDRTEAIGGRLELANRVAWHRSVASVENQKVL